MSIGKKIGIGVLALGLFAATFVGGTYFGYRTGIERPKTLIIRGVTDVDPAGNASRIDFSPFWEAWDAIDTYHLNAADANAKERVYGAMRGLVGALDDPYSEFFDPKDSKKFEEDVQGNFGGIGAEIGKRDGTIVVIAPLAGMPAERAGLLPGDAILLVNASSTDGLSVDETVRMIRGPQGSEVVLTVLRKGWEVPRDFSIVRDTIIAPTLDAELREGDIAYIKLHSFNANASELFRQALLNTLLKGAQGMVLDLRNNPGGYLEVAVDIAGWFLPRGTLVVKEESRQGVLDELRAYGTGALKNFPVLILVNEGSASASEILAGSLRDNRQVRLFGQTTFGKGTVQQIVDLRDGSTLKLTIAHWVLPSGQILEGEGLAPDTEVVPSDEDIASGNDVQLSAALRMMREMIAANSVRFTFTP